MDTTLAFAHARELMDTHGLAGWSLAWDRARRRAGTCRHARRTLTLSRPLIELYEPGRVREVVLHEIAHALVGPEHGHDATWRAAARAIGSTGARTVDPGAPRPPARWRGNCARGHVVERYRRPSAALSCAACSPRYDPDHLLSWTHDGRPVATADLTPPPRGRRRRSRARRPRSSATRRSPREGR